MFLTPSLSFVNYLVFRMISIRNCSNVYRIAFDDCDYQLSNELMRSRSACLLICTIVLFLRVVHSYPEVLRIEINPLHLEECEYLCIIINPKPLSRQDCTDVISCGATNVCSSIT